MSLDYDSPSLMRPSHQRSLLLYLIVIFMLVGLGLGLLRWLAQRRLASNSAARNDQSSSAPWTGKRPDRSVSTRADAPLAPAMPSGNKRGQVVLQGKWGSGPGEFGFRPAQESSPEGPASFFIDRHGQLIVLDQVNRRAQRFSAEGHYRETLAIDSSTAMDLALDDQGNLLVLDPWRAGGVLEVYGTDGRALKSVMVVGGQVRESGAITGLFSDGDGAYVEVEHEDLVRVMDGAGQATGLAESIPGRPTRDGRLLIKAGIIEKQSGRVYVQAHGIDQKLAWETPLNLARPLLHVLLLDSDEQGFIYLGAEIGAEDPQTHDYLDLATVVVKLDQNGQEQGSLTLPPTTATEPVPSQPLVVGPDGTVYHLVAGPGGMQITAYRFDG